MIEKQPDVNPSSKKHPILVWSMISVLDRQGFLLILFLLWATPATVVHLDLDWQSYLQIMKLVAYLNCKIISFSWSHCLSAHLQRGSSSVLVFYQYNGRWRETFWLSHAISTSPRQLEKKSLHQFTISSSMGPLTFWVRCSSILLGLKKNKGAQTSTLQASNQPIRGAQSSRGP